MQHLDVLCNRFGGRLVGSDAYENAALWCASEFRKWGMEVIMDEAGTVPVGFNRGPWFGRMLSDNGMIASFCNSFIYIWNHGGSAWSCSDRTKDTC